MIGERGLPLTDDFWRWWREPPTGATQRSLFAATASLYLLAAVLCGVGTVLLPVHGSRQLLALLLCATAALAGVGLLRLRGQLPGWMLHVCTLYGLAAWALWAGLVAAPDRGVGALAAPLALVAANVTWVFSLRAATGHLVAMVTVTALTLGWLGAEPGEIVLVAGSSLVVAGLATYLARLRDVVLTYFEHIGGEAFMKDLSGRYLLANEQFARSIGHCRPDVLGHTDFELIPPERAERFRSADLAVARSRTVHEQHVTELIGDDERIRRIVRFPIVGVGGEAVAVGGVVTDVTEAIRSQAERALNEEQWRVLFAHVADGVLVLSPQGTIESANATFCEMLGRTEAELAGRPVSDFYHAENEEPFEESFARIASGEARLLRKVYARADGSPFYARLRAISVFGNDGQLARIISIYSDDAADRQEEAERLRTEKLDAVGSLASGVAHDINNLLNGIVGYAELLQQSDTDATRLGYTAQVMTSALRASDYTSRLLSLARTGDDAQEVFDLHAVVREVLQILRASVPDGIALGGQLLAERAWTTGNPSQIHGALLNLGLNAAQAIEHAGTIEFATEDAPGEHICIRVTDTGHGIAPGALHRVFDPFFTTKAHGRGTGLGLTSVLAAVTRHGGTIDVASEVGSGTTFTVILPVTDAPAGPPDTTSPVGLPSGTPVIVVDDDDAVRFVVADALRRHGCAVSEAPDGATALMLLEQADPRPAVMVFDLRMPGMSGGELFRAVRDRWPDVGAVLMSGFGGDAEATALRSEGLDVVMQKPFRSDELVAAVARTLATAD